MSNIKTLEEILSKLRQLDRAVKDTYVKCAVQANIIKYQKQLEEEHKKNALDIVAYKLRHLTEKLK